MPEKHKINSDGEATAYRLCDKCGMAVMEYMNKENEAGKHLHKCIDCGAEASYQDIYPYRDPQFDRVI